MQDNINSVVPTIDGSNTLFSQKYNQHFHNLDDGAINESLNKHIIPTINYHKSKEELNILDMCFGIGYNTLTTIWYLRQNNIHKIINIYSPELDGELIASLKDFKYPDEFSELKEIINSLATTNKYEDGNIRIEIFIGDARNYLKSLPKNFFDIIYQDAFSSEVNMELWTKEYFDDLYYIARDDCIMSTYSIASPVRLSMNEAGFFIYEYRPAKRKITLSFKQKQNTIGKYIDMDLKKTRNTTLKAIYDQKL